MAQTYSIEFKEEACKRVQSGVPAAQVAREPGVNVNTLYTWMSRFKEHPTEPFVGSGKTAGSGPAFPCFVRRPQAASGQLVPRGSWPWGWQVPHSRRWCWSLVLPWEKSPRTRRPAPRVHPGPPAIQLWRRKNFLSYTTRKMEQMETAITDFFSNIFSSVRCR